MARHRTFVAVDIDAPLRKRVAALMLQLAGTSTAIKWVAPENLHFTLKFLGDVPETEIYAVCQAVKLAVAEFVPFRIFCHGLGAFPDLGRPRTVWLGVDREGQRHLQGLHERVETEITALGYPCELRPFRAHLTIGRVPQHSRRLEKLLSRLTAQADVELGSLMVEGCTVYTSELRSSGPRYTAVGRMPFGG